MIYIEKLQILKNICIHSKVSGKSDGSLQFFVNNSKTADYFLL